MKKIKFNLADLLTAIKTNWASHSLCTAFTHEKMGNEKSAKIHWNVCADYAY